MCARIKTSPPPFDHQTDLFNHPTTNLLYQIYDLFVQIFFLHFLLFFNLKKSCFISFFNLYSLRSIYLGKRTPIVRSFDVKRVRRLCESNFCNIGVDSKNHPFFIIIIIVVVVVFLLNTHFSAFYASFLPNH